MGRLVLRSSIAAVEYKSLRFPANTNGTSTSSPYGVLEYSGPPHLWGTGGGGWTIFNKLKFFDSIGYRAETWHTDDDSFETNITDGYWGKTVYPNPANNTATAWRFEIPVDQGDFVNNLNGNPIAVTLDQFYCQGFRVTRAGANSKTLRYWTDLEDVSNDTIIQTTITTAGYGEGTPSNRKLVIGNSPWMANYQEERGGFDLDWYLIYTPNVSVDDVIANADVTDPDSIVDYTGTTNLFWGKRGFTTIDGTAGELLCDYGTGRSFVRNDASSILSVVAR